MTTSAPWSASSRPQKGPATVAGRTDASRTDGGRETTRARSSGIVLLPDQENTVR